jgi:hypothetical protein
VRDAAGHVGPGCAALIGELLGDVVEGQDVTVLRPHQLDRECA